MLLLHLVFAFIDGSAPTTVVNQTSEPYVRFDGIGGLSGVSAFWTRVNAALFTETTFWVPFLAHVCPRQGFSNSSLVRSCIVCMLA